VTPRLAARVGWTLFAVTAAAAAFQFAARLPHLEEMGQRYDPYLTFPIITLAALVAALVGAVVVTRHPANPVGWLFCGANCVAEVGLAGETYAELSAVRESPLPGAGWGAFVQTLTGAPFALAGLTLLLLLFPSGRLASRRWRVVAWATGASLLVFEAGALSLPGAAGETPPTSRLDVEGALATVLIVGQLGIIGCLLAAATSVVLRMRRADGDERQQLRLVTFAVCALGTAVVGLALYEAVLADLGVARLVPETLFYLAYGGLPVAAGLAILKYRLYDIDVIVNRTVVFTGLAAVSTVGYVAVVVAVASLVGDRLHSGTVADLVVTAAVAVAVQPVRRRVVRLADRIAYGRRAAPYDVLAAFTERLASTLSIDEVPTRMAAASAQGVGALAATVEVRLEDGTPRSVVWPQDAPQHGNDVVVDVEHAGDAVGRIRLTLAPGHALSRESQALLADLARQAGVALHNVRLTVALEERLHQLQQQNVDLAASRRRLLAAQTTEQQRFERELAERVRPHLAAVGAGLAAVRRRTVVDHGASASVELLVVEATAALEALRDIARGVYPPLLVDHGLLPAIEAAVAAAPGRIAVTVGDPAAAERGVRLTRFPAGTEAAAYFCLTDVLATVPPDAQLDVVVAVQGDCLELRVGGADLPRETVDVLEDRAGARGGTVRLDREAPAVIVQLPGTRAQAQLVGA
jgi:hypothetical protein